MKKKPNQEKRAAFTLIEMLVVVVIIGILIAGVFRLMGAAGESNKKALTVARLQKMQNALSGFYAEYGTYPPVVPHDSPDPYARQDPDTGTAKSPATSLLVSDAAEYANKAAGSQPIAFEYPSPDSATLNTYINERYKGIEAENVNDALGQSAASPTLGARWQDAKIFKFGVLSYLLPRVQLIGGDELAKDNPDPEQVPDMNFFGSQQWSKNNAGSRAAQSARENRAVARWLPNFENSLYGGYNNMCNMGINTAEPEHGGPHFSGPYRTQSSPKYMLMSMTIHDGWGHELYYYSAPPYQSYRIWSAGPNGITFPPWITLESLPSEKDREMATLWIEDDIVRFDH